MGAEEGEDPNDPPKEGEVVYADARHVLCRRWNWRQDARTAVTPETRRVALTAQSNGSGDVEAAAARFARRSSANAAALPLVVADRAGRRVLTTAAFPVLSREEPAQPASRTTRTARARL